MQPIQFAGYNSANPFTTAANAQQDFELRKALAAQQLQTGGIDAATKANIYKTQLLAGAVAGGQPAYDQARQTLKSQGIDTSEFAPDVQTATTQINAARLAQAPAMQLLNTAIQANRNGIEASAQTGNNPPALVIPGLTPPSSVPIPAPTNIPPSHPVVSPNQARGVMTEDQFNSLFQPQPADVQATADAKYGSPQPNVIPNASPGTTPNIPVQNSPTPSSAPQVNTGLPGGGNAVAGTSIPPFVAPPNDSTKNLQWNQDNYKNALDTYNNRQDVIASKAAAGESGKASIEYGEKSAVATEMVSRLDKNFEAMLAANPDVPQSRWGVSAADKAWLSQNFGDQSDAAAYSGFSKVNKAQILNGLQELVSSGAIRNSRPLIQLVADVNAIDENAAPAIRAQQVRTVQTEMHNLATQSQNVNARMTGGALAPYQDLPATATSSNIPMQRTPSGIPYKVVQ